MYACVSVCVCMHVCVPTHTVYSVITFPLAPVYLQNALEEPTVM